MKIELSLLDIIEQRKKAPLRLGVLRAVGQVLRAGVALRHFAYDQKLFSSIQLPIPVISVGNILVGGTGKTPFVALLARELSKTRKVAIASRGYRAIHRYKQPFLITKDHSAAVCGDEPLMLAKKLPQVEVIVSADRVAAAEFGFRRGAEIVLLDDGMQHRRLFRTEDIVLLAFDNLFGGGWFLPGGLLRDTPKRLRQARLIAVTGVEKAEDFAACKEKIAVYSQAPVIGLQTVVKNQAALRGKRVGIFCAIARPQRLIQTVQKLGCEIVHAQFYPDHSAFPDLRDFEEKAYQKGAEILVCTEKDAVKTSCFCTPVEIELVASFEEQWLEQLIEEYK